MPLFSAGPGVRITVIDGSGPSYRVARTDRLRKARDDRADGGPFLNLPPGTYQSRDAAGVRDYVNKSAGCRGGTASSDAPVTACRSN